MKILMKLTRLVGSLTIPPFSDFFIEMLKYLINFSKLHRIQSFFDEGIVRTPCRSAQSAPTLIAYTLPNYETKRSEEMAYEKSR